MLFLGVEIHCVFAAENEIHGVWECVVNTGEAEDLYYSLRFTEPDTVTFTAGWYQSEVASLYTGRYVIEGSGLLRLEMADSESTGSFSGTYSFEVSEGLLVLIRQSGDGLSYLYEADVPMAFRSVSGYEPAQGMTVEQALDLLRDDFMDADLFHPGELDRQVGEAAFYGFAYTQGDAYGYVWVNSATGGVELAEEVENYTGGGASANTAAKSDGELIDYLLASVPDAYRRVQLMDRGLTAFVTGETTILSMGICRDIWLGMGNGASFPPVIVYTISPFGSIYEHNPENGVWNAVYVKPDD